jgi:hypothetical protein
MSIAMALVTPTVVLLLLLLWSISRLLVLLFVFMASIMVDSSSKWWELGLPTGRGEEELVHIPDMEEAEADEDGGNG